MRPITDILRDIRKGKLVELASDRLAEVVKAVQTTQKNGEVVITLKVKADEDEGVIRIDGTIKAKVPEPSVGEAIFFATEDGDLIRSDPRQSEMFSEADSRKAADVRTA